MVPKNLYLQLVPSRLLIFFVYDWQWLLWLRTQCGQHKHIVDELLMLNRQPNTCTTCRKRDRDKERLTVRTRERASCLSVRCVSLPPSSAFTLSYRQVIQWGSFVLAEIPTFFSCAGGKIIQWHRWNSRSLHRLLPCYSVWIPCPRFSYHTVLLPQIHLSGVSGRGGSC